MHVRTDYVFDGTKQEPYVETDEPHLQSAYGTSKHAGKPLLRDFCEPLAEMLGWLEGPGGSERV